MSDAPTPPQRLSPREGDVVVTRETETRSHYTVRQLPGMVQFSADVRDEAVQLARGFGREHAVDVWYTDRSTYRLLEAYRPRTLVHAAESSAADIERVRR